MSLRAEFVRLADGDGANVRESCRRFGISPTTGYAWLARFREAGGAGLAERSRRPATSPGQTAVAVETRVPALRAEHPTWGGRTLQRRLHDLGEPAPAPSTITAILRRRGLIDPAVSAAHRPWRRFAAADPNDLWRLDFTGHFALGRGRCRPSPVLDGHSRFLLGLRACADQTGPTVQAHPTALFHEYGLPTRVLCGDGAPWGTRAEHNLTTLSVWLIRLGVQVIHGRPRHPQTQGKLERLNRTLGADAILVRRHADLAEIQTAFDAWRHTCNHDRPHGALDLETPVRHYAPSARPFPAAVPEIVHAPGDELRIVNAAGTIAWQRRPWRISHALSGLPVGVRPTAVDGVVEVRFCGQFVRTLDRRADPTRDD